MSNATDPRDASLETKLTLPKTWYADANDSMGSMGMFLAGMVLVTRNRYLSWPVLLLAISGVTNQHPLRTKDGGNSPWAILFMAILAVIMSHAPLFLLPKQTASGPVPIF
ncbi:hypothetical protein SERLA73DRAFT_167343 [Serpula lacrymans var. lacrymans S7.3]|uniref:Uncharacterized protein n=2 Tax=Serpula lacrymans var. lacrymans TaxID=341189 RepID=F8PS36_SERL3|nr:uncharacterized protein SERLADRAFT_464419 [Serpula lacrymans var. lacrymans S7.9]EGO01218.1 hypothetical protein SERLA73DRAFT_167343 [Serpula lacrymans var. lacrymans S7.3]EGO26867.1 hypothetical protein SERLADRAFT_464419 [Serpula lacrymans var. lacrymans S7.9]